MSSSKAECAVFSGRLVECFANARMPKIGPTMLQREFNLRSKTPVTVHAARKWLVGEAIPTQEKLRVLASWLQVSPDWLRYGEGNSEFSSFEGLPKRDTRTLTDLARLTPTNRDLVDDIIGAFLKSQKTQAEPEAPANPNKKSRRLRTDQI